MGGRREEGGGGDSKKGVRGERVGRKEREGRDLPTLSFPCETEPSDNKPEIP